MAVGYGLILPGIAVLHPLHRAVRDSGAVLATVAGVAAVVVGLAGAVNVDLQPAALFIRGMWWWTVGKMWATTAVLPRSFGVGTAALGVLALAATFAASANVPDLAIWDRGGIALGVWLIALATALWRVPSAVPSR